MKPWIKNVAVASAAVATTAGAASALGSAAWARTTSRTIDRLAPPKSTPRTERFLREQLEGLPAPVVRYFGLGHHRHYTRVSGMMIPTKGEVEWILPEGRLNYWRGRITAAEYQFAQ